MSHYKYKKAKVEETCSIKLYWSKFNSDNDKKTEHFIEEFKLKQ